MAYKRKAAPAKKAVKNVTKKAKAKKIPAALDNLDVAFIIDVTGSMGPYIAEAKRMVTDILKKLQEEKGVNIRVALSVYRDHPPQDLTLVSKGHDFVDLNAFDAVLAPYGAQGGGDWEEAVYDGINEVLNFSWRDKSDRAVYLIGDAAPHENCLCGLTPKKLIAELKKLKIEVNAHSIANDTATTKAFKEFVDATGGTITVGNRPEYSTSLYTDSLTTKSDDIVGARAFVAAAASAGINYMDASSLTTGDVKVVATSLSISEDEAKKHVTYLAKRGL